MLNILISKTDPYSFMGLLKASDTRGALTTATRSLMNAGVVSLFLVVGITYMAQGSVEATQNDRRVHGPFALSSDTSLPSNCHSEACNLV